MSFMEEMRRFFFGEEQSRQPAVPKTIPRGTAVRVVVISSHKEGWRDLQAGTWWVEDIREVLHLGQHQRTLYTLTRHEGGVCNDNCQRLDNVQRQDFELVPWNGRRT